MAKGCLPSMVDRVEAISAVISKQVKYRSSKLLQFQSATLCTHSVHYEAVHFLIFCGFLCFQTISKKERSELRRHKFSNYIRYELLHCALTATFRRDGPRASSGNVFPSTSFQYARSRLRRKLESVFFNESEVSTMTPIHRKRKEEWIKKIESKRDQYKMEYLDDRRKRENAKRNRACSGNTMTSNSMTMSLSSSRSVTVSNSSDRPIYANSNTVNLRPQMARNHEHRRHEVHGHHPATPRPSAASTALLPNHKMNGLMPGIPGIGMNGVNGKSSGYCSNCTGAAIQLAAKDKELEDTKRSLGDTLMELNTAKQDVVRWRKKYVEKSMAMKEMQKGHNKEMHRLRQQLRQQMDAILAANRNTANSSSHGATPGSSILDAIPSTSAVFGDLKPIQTPSSNSRTLLSAISSHSRGCGRKMSLSSEAHSVRDSEIDKMSFSGGSGSMMTSFKRAPFGDEVSGNMAEIERQHLKHSSNSTEKMIEALKRSEGGLRAALVGGSNNSLMDEANSDQKQPDHQQLISPPPSERHNCGHGVHVHGDRPRPVSLLDIPAPMTVPVGSVSMTNNGHLRSLTLSPAVTTVTAQTQSTFNSDYDSHHDRNRENVRRRSADTRRRKHHHVRSPEQLSNLNLHEMHIAQTRYETESNGTKRTLASSTQMGSDGVFWGDQIGDVSAAAMAARLQKENQFGGSEMVPFTLSAPANPESSTGNFNGNVLGQYPPFNYGQSQHIRL